MTHLKNIEIPRFLARAVLAAIVYIVALVACMIGAVCEGCGHFVELHKDLMEELRDFWKDTQP